MASLRVSSSSSSSSCAETRIPDFQAAVPLHLLTTHSASKIHKATGNTVRKKSGQSSSILEAAKAEAHSSIPLKATAALQSTSEVPVKKTSSTQTVKKSETPMKRTLSAQNVSRYTSVTSQPNTPNISKIQSVKRAASSQNVSSKGRQRQSAPVNAMAYNAELLASFEKEKKSLERRISEVIQIAEMRKTENEKLKFEIKNYLERIPPENVFEELELLRRENCLLRDRLHEADISLEHFTDSEKLAMLEKQNNAVREAMDSGTGQCGVVGCDSALKLHSTSDAESRDVESVGDPSCTNIEQRSCLSLDCNWDKQSNKSSEGGLSEVSVACLQDRILQMEESHYSTNEELQATLQELTDLQTSVNDLTAENERLADENRVLLQSLCAQTEKLENARFQIEQMKELLLSGYDAGERSELEQQLVALVKGAQEEKDELILRQMELSNVLQTFEDENHELQELVLTCKNKSQSDEAKVEDLVSDKKMLEQQVAGLKDQTVRDQLEIQHLKALLDNEKHKVAELEQERHVTSKSDLEVLRDSTQHEKDGLEDQITNEEQELLVKQNEIMKLKEQLDSTKLELKMVDESLTSRIQDLESQLNQTECEKLEMQAELEVIREQNDQLQMTCDQYLDEQKTYTLTVARAESELRMTRLKIARLETELKEKTDQFAEEREGWKQFQQDLQVAVVIANDIKTETEEGLEKIQADREFMQEQNLTLKQELEAVQLELERLKQAQQQQRTIESPPVVNPLDIRGKVLNTVDRELAARRHGRLLTEAKTMAPNLSVKHLISSIEMKNDTPSIQGSTSVTSPILMRCDSTDSTKNISSVKPSEAPKKPSLLRQPTSPSTDSSLETLLRRKGESKDSWMPTHRHTIADIIMDSVTVTDDDKQAVAESVSPSVFGKENSIDGGRKPLTGILTRKRKTSSFIGDVDRSPDKAGNHLTGHLSKSDPLALLAKQFNCSKRNALLKWCQNKTATYTGIDITNFSSSWNDGLAFCALLHTFLPDMIPYKELNSQDKARNFTLAFKATESAGISNNLNLTEMLATERPDWQAIMLYVTNIYRHLEADRRT